MPRATHLLALLTLLWVAAPCMAKKTQEEPKWSSMAPNLSPKHHKKGTKWSPKSGIKPGTNMYLVETKDNPKKGKLKGENELGPKIPGLGNGMLTNPESEGNLWTGDTWKDDDTWATDDIENWTENNDKWTETPPSWDSPEVTGEPEDLKWTETTPLWDPMNPGGTWNHDHDKWTGAEPEPEGKWKDDGKWTEPEPGPEDPRWTETTPIWDMSGSTPGPNTWTKAECVLSGDAGVGGTVHFAQHGSGAVKLTGEVTGLHDGLHGFHVHEFGDATDGCKSAGSHYNPDGSDHGGPTASKGSRHAGDLGNLEGHGGSAKVDIEDKMISLMGKDSIIGRSMMVHAKEDDLTKDADPGPRLACGVIGLAEGHSGDDVDGKWTTMVP